MVRSLRPIRAKAIGRDRAFALSGRIIPHPCTQGDALGWELIGLSGRFYIGLSLLAELKFLINGHLIVNEELERDTAIFKILTELLQVLLQHLAAAVFVEELHHDGTCMFRDA